MQFVEGRISGAYVVEPERRIDERGYFARMFCTKELSERGLCDVISQVNTGVSPRAGTLRGIHYQLAPHDEVKIVRCVRGAVIDVIVDLRPNSPSFKKWMSAELSAHNGKLLYAPAGTAHGYLSLIDDTELIYFTNKAYSPSSARGIRFDDPMFRIAWDSPIHVVSDADRSWPNFRD